jgi:hypothetical protein
MTTETRYYTASETGQLARKALKAAFPGTKFSVRTNRVLRVEWTNGPTRSQVEDVVGCFAGADFDGMQDLQTTLYHEVDGQRVHYGVSFVFVERRVTEDHLRPLVEQACAKYGIPAIAIEVSGTGWAHIVRDYSSDIDTAIYREIAAIEEAG